MLLDGRGILFWLVDRCCKFLWDRSTSRGWTNFDFENFQIENFVHPLSRAETNKEIIKYSQGINPKLNNFAGCWTPYWGMRVHRFLVPGILLNFRRKIEWKEGFWKFQFGFQIIDNISLKSTLSKFIFFGYPLKFVYLVVNIFKTPNK